MFKNLKKFVDFVRFDLLTDDDKIQQSFDDTVYYYKSLNQQETLATLEKLETKIYYSLNGLLPTKSQLKELVETRFWELEADNQIDVLNKLKPEALNEILTFIN